jgi:hypothetical protein
MAKLPTVTPVCAMTQGTYLTAACIGTFRGNVLIANDSKSDPLGACSTILSATAGWLLP